MLSVPFCGTRLCTVPLESSLLSTTDSEPKLAPVKTPSTVSKLLPNVSKNEFGAGMANEHGAVHVHQALGVPLPMTSKGSPGSAVNPTLEPVAVRAPAPVMR